MDTHKQTTLLSLNQRKVLTVFARRDDVTVREVVQLVHLPRPTAKQVLARLLNAKLIERSGRGRGSTYNLKQQNEVIDSRGQRVVSVFKGAEAFRALFAAIEKKLVRDSFYWSFAFKNEYLDPEVAELLRSFHARLARKGVRDLSVAHEDTKETVLRTYKENKNIKFRFTKQEIPIGTIVLKDEVVNLVWGKRPIAISITEPAIIDHYRNFFISTWNAAVRIGSDRFYVVPKPGNTPIVSEQAIYGVENLFIKDESVNPTHTFKDRLAYEMVRPTLESILAGSQPKPVTFSSISYGNTAKAMGFYANVINKLHGKEVVRAIAFVPPKLSSRTFGPDSDGHTVPFRKIKNDLNKTVRLIPIDLKKKIYSSRDLEEIARKRHAVIGEFVDITEGLNRPAYVNIIIESIEQQFKASPDYVVVPFGAGILANEIIDYVAEHKLHTKVIPVSSGNPDTIAVMLYGPIWVDTEALRTKGKAFTRHAPVDRKGHKREPYIVYNVSDKDIREAMGKLADVGVTAEPSGASGIAILRHLKKIDPKFNPKKHSVLVINTGDGLINYT